MASTPASDAKSECNVHDDECNVRLHVRSFRDLKNMNIFFAGEKYIPNLTIEWNNNFLFIKYKM